MFEQREALCIHQHCRVDSTSSVHGARWVCGVAEAALGQSDPRWCVPTVCRKGLHNRPYKVILANIGTWQCLSAITTHILIMHVNGSSGDSYMYKTALLSIML